EQVQAKEQLAMANEAGAEDAIKEAEIQKQKADEKVKAARLEHTVQKEMHEDLQNIRFDAREALTKATEQRKQAAEAVSKATEKEAAAEKQLQNNTKQLANEKKNAAKQEAQTERSVIQTIKAYDKQNDRLAKLTEKHGDFNVTLGKGVEEMNDMEREVLAVIKSDKQLEAAIDKLIAKQGRLNVEMRRGQFRQRGGVQATHLRQAGFAAERLGVPGGAAIGEAGGVGMAFGGTLAAGAAVAAIAAVVLVVQALIKGFMQLAKIGADAFASLIKGSVEAAKEMEIAQAQFNAFFQQDTSAANAAMERLLKLSKELGENVVGIGRAFLPEVRDLDQLERVVKIATALARYQPEQGIFGARIALQEALSGEFRSLRRRFEISPVAIDQIKDAFEEAGIEGLLEQIESELRRTGRDVEALGDTFRVTLGRIQERFRQLQATIGEPILEEMKEELRDVDEELVRINPQLDVLAEGLGEVVARLVDLVGTQVEDFLADFDPQPIQDVVEALFAAVDAFGILMGSLTVGETAWDTAEGGARAIASVLLWLEGFFLNTALSIAKFRDELNLATPVMEAAADVLGMMEEHAPKQVRGLSGFAKNIVEFEIEFATGGRTAAEIEAEMVAHEKRVEAFGKGLDFSMDASIAWQDEAEDTASATMRITKGFEDLIKIQGDYVEAQERVNDIVNEFNIDAAMKFEKMLTDAARARMKAEIGFAERTIDIERKNRQKIADIRLKFDQDILRSAQNLTDREADILRKHGRDIAKLEEDLNDERLKIEQKYRDDLERIRDKFDFDAFEAMLANDGKRLRQLRRRQAFEEEQAKKDRDKGLRDVDDSADDRRQKLDQQLAQELEDARIANARKLRDLETALKETFRKQEEARRRELAEQGINEIRKRAE
ncbi:MAG: hypothetical protein ACXAB4_11290, partial [Candidatus Hodarchaeales archaeon]